MSKKIVKLAIIRKNDADPCPFGLKIPQACKCVGETISKMAPLSILEDASEEELAEIALANKRVFNWQADGTRCPYAGQLMQDKKAVECNFGSDAPGIAPSGLTPSPFFSRQYTDVAYDGLYSYPMGWYGDHNISRNLYYSIYTMTSRDDDLIKFASYIEYLDSKFFDISDEERQILVNFAKSDNNLLLTKKASKNLLEEKISNILLKWKESNGSR